MISARTTPSRGTGVLAMSWNRRGAVPGRRPGCLGANYSFRPPVQLVRLETDLWGRLPLHPERHM